MRKAKTLPPAGSLCHLLPEGFAQVLAEPAMEPVHPNALAWSLRVMVLFLTGASRGLTDLQPIRSPICSSPKSAYLHKGFQ